MIIDCHQHVVLPIADQLALMDEAGIDRTVLLSTLPHVERTRDLASFRSEMAVLGRVLAGDASGRRVPSQELAASVAAAPDRFIAFGKVPVGLSRQDTEKALQEEVIDPGYSGIGELTFAGDAAAGLEPVFQVSADAPGGPLPLLVHGFLPQTLEDLKTTAELAAKYPQVPAIIGVLGGLHWLETVDLLKQTPNLYLDLGSSFVSLAPRVAVAEVPDRCLFGSNTPFADAYTNRILVERVIPDAGVRRRVLGENLAELLGIG